MRRHVLITNDFPPKVGGIQSYLWELWRRLPAEDFYVYTTPFQGDREFDSGQHFRTVRSANKVLLPTPNINRNVQKLRQDIEAELIVWDPAFPLALSAVRSRIPYALVLHGAELAIPGKMPVVKSLLANTLKKASLVICAGNYPAEEAERIAKQSLPIAIIPPGVDVERFCPATSLEKEKIRKDFGIPRTSPVLLALTRLVPRKGIDVLIQAVKVLKKDYPELLLLIGGTGRDLKRLKDLAKDSEKSIRFLGEISEEDLPELYRMSDIFCMPCRSRWGGLEQEGFGIVFLEAAASGVPQIAGKSGGSADAVSNNETGFIIDNPKDPRQLAQSIKTLLQNSEKLERMGLDARKRAENHFSYDQLSKSLIEAIDSATLQ
ncbi:MAG: glycosyltransferase family 4 protein [Acidimicrobiales bacterium]|nr:glycosyltransferase family 4 protein [Acidimicrobiales bacterium]